MGRKRLRSGCGDAGRRTKEELIAKVGRRRKLFKETSWKAEQLATTGNDGRTIFQPMERTLGRRDTG
jgi:hypothetical protein